MRLAKFLAQQGVSSRRECERMIIRGEVLLNSELVMNVVTFLKPHDVVAVKGKVMHYKSLKDFQLNIQKRTKVWLMHKPRGTIVSRYDPQGRKTVFDILPSYLKQLIAVGRLDFNTEGLLLFTNNGVLARELELPKNQVERIYRCRLFYGDLGKDGQNYRAGKSDKFSKGLANYKHYYRQNYQNERRYRNQNFEKQYIKMAKELSNGVKIDGICYRPIKMRLEKIDANRAWVEVRLVEGKNREIRKIFDYYNIQVTRLIRLSYGAYELGGLAKGAVVEEGRLGEGVKVGRVDQ